MKKIDSNMILFAIADGLGGQLAGHIAAQTAMQAIENFTPDCDNLNKEVEDLIHRAINQLQNYPNLTQNWNIWALP